MDPQDTQLLDAIWSWARGITAVLSIGVLAAAALGAALGMLPLARARRDWRSPTAMLGVAVFLAAAGSWALFTVARPAPTWSFWLILSLQVGTLTFWATTVLCGRFSFAQRRRDRLALEAISTPIDDTPEPDVPARPQPRSRLSGIEAEYYVAEWMRHLGATDAVVTPARRDGGIDVRSAYYVAQVKHQPRDFVTVEMIRSLLGAASLEGRATLFFASGTYSRDARDVAQRAGMALFVFRHQENRLVPANPLARQLQLSGLATRPLTRLSAQPAGHPAPQDESGAETAS